MNRPAMTITDKLTTIRLAEIGCDNTPVSDVLSLLRRLFHEADEHVEQPTEEWGIPVGHLLSDACANALQPTLRLENCTALEALLSTAESVGCHLFVNETGAFVVPPAFTRSLPVVERDAQGQPVPPESPSGFIPGIPPCTGTARQRAADPPDMIQRAFEATLPSFVLEDASPESAVRFMADLLPDIPVVVDNPADGDLPSVTLIYPEDTSLGEVLAAIEGQTGMEAIYSRTGIILRLLPEVTISPEEPSGKA